MKYHVVSLQGSFPIFNIFLKKHNLILKLLEAQPNYLRLIFQAKWEDFKGKFSWEKLPIYTYRQKTDACEDLHTTE